MAVVKAKPERTCIACREKKTKKELIRIVHNKDGETFLDPKGNMNGRGAYVCSADCFAKAYKSQLLNRAFKCSVSSEVYEQLKKEIEDLEDK